MAQTKAKRPSRAKAPSDAERIEREYRRLALAVGDVQAFRLYLATYNDPRRRDELIERLTTESERQSLKVTRLDVSGCHREVSLVRLLREHVEEGALPSGWRRAVMVVGIEQLLDYTNAKEGLAVLETANLQRDVFPEAVPLPVVFWLSPLASSAFPKAAPDLWHWRGASFNFTGRTESRADLLRDMIPLPTERWTQLSGPQGRERVAMLKDLIAELDQTRPHKSLRETAELAGVLSQLGRTYFDLGSFSEARSTFERQVEIAQEAGDRGLLGWALYNLSGTYFKEGELERAVENFRRGLEIAREIGDRWLEGGMLQGLGQAHLGLRDPERARDYLEQVLEISRETDRRWLEGWTFFGLAMSYRIANQLALSVEHFEKALQIARELGERPLEGWALNGLADVYRDAGALDSAVEHHQKALQVAHEIGDRSLETMTLTALADSYRDLGESQRAIEHALAMLALSEKLGDEYLANRARARLAELDAERTGE